METTLYEIKNPHTEDVYMQYKGSRFEIASGETIKNITEEVANHWVGQVHPFLQMKKMTKNSIKDEVEEIQLVPEEPELIKEAEIEEIKEIEEVKEQVLEEVKVEAVKTSKK